MFIKIFSCIVLGINALLYLSIFLKTGTDEKIVQHVSLGLATFNILIIVFIIKYWTFMG